MGSWAGSTAGVSVGSLLVPGFGSEGFGAGEFSLGGASAPSSACVGLSPVLPSDLLVSPSSYLAALGFSTSGHVGLSSVSSPASFLNCCSSASSLPVNLTIAMPFDQ